jgi:hypothetical protein
MIHKFTFGYNTHERDNARSSTNKLLVARLFVAK